MITREQLGKFIDRKTYAVKESDLLVALNTGMDDALIHTNLQMAMFLAQTCHETGGFNWFVEMGTDDYLKKYEFRKDLGNIHKGDGPKFKGRGMIQITGRANYTKVTRDLGLDLLEHPELAEDLVTGARIAGWFWNLRALNIPSDAGDIRRVTKVINGGLNGFADRTKWYLKAKNVLDLS